MKNVFKIIIIILISALLCSCVSKNNNVNEDSLKFKEEYENENNKTNTSGKEIRNLEIPNNNPFIYKNAKDIVNSINNKESFIVYFGFSTCPWCRSVLPSLIESAKDNNIKQIYYVDVKEIRDVLEYDENKKTVVTKQNGDESYMELLNLLSNVLSDYTLTDTSGKNIDTKEKRIYAPNIIKIENGKATDIKTGITESLTDPYMDLTDEIKEEIKKEFNIILESDVCTKEGC